MRTNEFLSQSTEKERARASEEARACGGREGRKGKAFYSFAMSSRAAMRPNTMHSVMLPLPWYFAAQMDPNSPDEYRLGMGSPSTSRICAFSLRRGPPSVLRISGMQGMA